MTATPGRRFANFACIDWSGAIGATTRGIALAQCERGGGAPRLILPAAGIWSRQGVLELLRGLAEDRADILVGMDFSTSLPFVDAGAFLPGEARSPGDARALWAFVDATCVGDAHLAATGFVADAEIARHFRLPRGREGDRFGGGIGRLRQTERACRAAGIGAAQSCFNLVGPAQVGKASLAGMRVLHRLNGAVPIWPFDPVPAAGPVIVENYTAIAARAAGLRGRTKLCSGTALDRALRHEAIASAPAGVAGAIDDHSADALLGAAWLRRAADDAALWRLPPGHAARREGWTFGVACSTWAAVPA